MRSFVTATMISERLCSPRRDGQELLPQLVAKLITASIPGEAISKFRFPDGDQVYLHGEDGILALDESVQHLYAPSGISVWEMGTSMDPRSKANDDFAKAESKAAKAFPEAIPPVTPDKATFVFVTSKSWESSQWVRDKRASSNWKSIKVLDAVDLEKWIEQCPAVMLWFADTCGLPAEGLYDSEQYLRKLAVEFGVGEVSPELVIAGRDDELAQLQDLVLNGSANFQVGGESVEEGAGFLAAASLKDADTYSKMPPFVFADSRANLNVLATFVAELTLVPLDSEALACAQTIGAQKWRLVIPQVEATGARNKKKRDLMLRGCKRAAIEKHLIEGWKLPEHDARQIARDTKGSLVALLWLVGTGPMQPPRWATRKDATTHASLMLAGSWIGANEHDTKIVERLARREYRDIETLLQSAQIPEGPWIHRGPEWLCASRDFVWSQLLRKVTETMLADFVKVVDEVVGEKDPSLDLAPSDRRMASILGKTRKYSVSLRTGLADSVARLAVLKTDGQGWADRIVQDLLDPAKSDALGQWLSVRDVYSEIAEASPAVFLECLDAMLHLETAKGFFQDALNEDVIFGPTSAHVDLLWALERLAWLKQYFSRVLSVLARLAEIDPGGRTSRPKHTLVTILLPWCPQHHETMQNAADALAMLYSVSSTITWDVALELLPTSHSTTSPTPTPQYREHSGDRTVTIKDYWDFVRRVLEMMLEWAGFDASRWAALLKAYPEIRRGYPELGQLLTDALGQVNTSKLGEADKALIHDALRELLWHHRQFPDAEWALSAADLKTLEDLQEPFRPKDPVLEYRHLFSWDPDIPDAPMKCYEEGWDEWIAEQRRIAAKAVYDQDGLAGICRLAEEVVLPGCVGEAAATLPLAETEVVELIEKGLKSDPSCYRENPLANTSTSYAWTKYRLEGDAWLESVLVLPGITWTPQAYANLALTVSPSPALWKRLEQWAPEADTLYWKNVQIGGCLRDHWRHVLAKWKEVSRPWSSLELIAHLIDERHARSSTDKPSAEQVMDVLDQALKVDESVEPHRRQGGMLSYYVEHIFLFLDDQAVEQGKLASLEWGWLRILENTKRGAKALQTQVTSSAELFVELLKVLYRAEGEPKSEKVSKDQERIATQAHHLLKGIHTMPGSRSANTDEAIDSSTLRDWVLRTRELAKDAGRLRVCDSQIGQILSYAPPAPDGSWPCVEVRDLIEELKSPKLEKGLWIGKCNQRGVVCREKGGTQEWKLATKYRGLADKIRARWPRTASILDSLAKGYEGEASHWDEDAKRDEYE